MGAFPPFAMLEPGGSLLGAADSYCCYVGWGTINESFTGALPYITLTTTAIGRTARTPAPRASEAGTSVSISASAAAPHWRRRQDCAPMRR